MVKTIPGTNVQSDETEELDAILERQKPGCASFLTAFKKEFPDVEVRYAYGYPVAGADESGFGEALSLAEGADMVILTLGGKHGTCSLATMGEGVDASDINLPPCQEKFIREVSKLQIPLVGIHFDGRPISSDAADTCLNAILEAWSPAEMGAQAVAEALVGKVNPGGKLPVTVARTAGQIPVIYNHPNASSWHQSGSIGFADYVDLPHTPRYYFGYGLSYTSFTYGNLELSKQEIGPAEEVSISCQVENTGDIRGDEVIQLYLKDIYASMVRPVKELAGFRRITLEPGEKKQIIFTVKASQMAFLDEDMQWKIEKGLIGVEIGSSSEDIRLEDSFRITEDGWVSGRERGFYADVRVEGRNGHGIFL